MTAFGCRARRHNKIGPTGLLLATMLAFLSVPPAHAASPITLENARPGQTDWVLTDPADHEVEGYASATSINRGEQLRLYIHSTDPAVTIAIYRMGWYGTGSASRRRWPRWRRSLRGG